MSEHPPSQTQWANCGRFVQQTSLDRTRQKAVYAQGQKQAALALERFHYLRAAATGAFALTDVPPDFARGQIFARKGVVFAAYGEAQLPPVLGVKLHPRADGTVHPEDLALYLRGFRASWKAREGGVLYCVGEGREFWNMVLNYHSPAATTGHKPWDRLFAAVKRGGADKSLVPCMFFAREIGCLDPDCPFKHDREACVRDREKVLDKRRSALGKPSARSIALRQRRAIRERQASGRQVVPVSRVEPLSSDDSIALVLADEYDEEDEVNPEIHRIFEESSHIRKICSNPNCLATKMKKGSGGEENSPKMLQCSRCTVATYCSKECQTADWKRHKQQPCKAFEELVADDDLWNEFGQLKGTSRFPINGG